MILPGTNVFETIYPYAEPPWTIPRWTVVNVGSDWKEINDQIQPQIDEETSKGACVIFTDGLFIPDVESGEPDSTVRLWATPRHL